MTLFHIVFVVKPKIVKKDMSLYGDDPIKQILPQKD